MRKNILLSLVAIAALTVSCKEKEDTPAVKGVITAETLEYSMSAEESSVVVHFSSNVDWKAAFEPEADWVSVKPKSGVAGDASVTVLADAFNETNTSRSAALVISGGDADPLKVTITQSGAFVPYFNVDNESLTIGIAGGAVSFNIETNVEFETTTYESFESWAPFALSGKTGTFTVSASKQYDARQAYVKFTIPSIQVPELDDNGNETGTTAAKVVRVYVSQDGSLTTSWETAIDGSDAANVYSAALAGDYLAVSTASGVYAYNKATGAAAGQLNLPIVPKGITNDDAGNVVFFLGGSYYGGGEGETNDPLKVWYLPADKLTDVSAAQLLITCTQNGFMSSYPLDNIRVTGDVTKDASITMCCAAGWAAGSYLLFWEVKDGAVAIDADRADNKWTDYVGLPWTTAIWASYNCVGMLAGTTVGSGVFFNGYDGNYNLHYNPSTSGSNWQEVFTTGSAGNEGYNAMDIIEWNGHKYLSMLGMTYAPAWGGSGDSLLFMLNVDDPAAPALVSKHSIYGGGGVSMTTDVVLDIEDGKLVAYVVDAAVCKISKIVYPAL